MKKNNIKKYIFVTILSLILSSCSSVSSQYKNENIQFTEKMKKEKIMNFYKEWEGTMYKYGGNSKDGIDCSSFIQQMYADAFNKSLPRTTDLLLKEGKEIHLRSNWKVGDLVFFKTGKSTNHVGIYIGDGKFIHTSTKIGVTMSEFDNYWKDKFIETRRVI